MACLTSSLSVHSLILLSVAALNVNGLTSKLNAGIIDVYLKAYDIICLLETLTDSIDLSNSFLHDFECYCLSRRSEQRLGGFHGIKGVDLYPWLGGMIGAKIFSAMDQSNQEVKACGRLHPSPSA